jgi:predicted DNA-binding protein
MAKKKEKTTASAATIVKELLEARIEKLEQRFDRLVNAIANSKKVKGI